KRTSREVRVGPGRDIRVPFADQQKAPGFLARGRQVLSGGRSVGSAAWAAPVEAPDQLAADGLLELARVDALVWRDESRIGHECKICTLILRPAVFRLPEKSWPPLEPIFIAGADEPAVEGVRRHVKALWVAVDDINDLSVVEMRLGEPAGHVGQE